MTNYSLLKDYATDVQLKYIKAWEKSGTVCGAAKLLGINERTLTRGFKSLKLKAASKGYDPDNDLTHSVAAGQSLKGASTLYDEEGNIKLQWVKSEKDKEIEQQLLQEALEAFNSQIKREKRIPAPKGTESELLNCYVITDYHLGMMSWHEETGADWDIKIAENLLVDWFKVAIKNSPSAETAIFAQLGDFLHFDSLQALTPEHKNLLDADTRFQKVVRVAIRSIRRIIKMLLEKHNHVHVLMAEGNHDPAASIQFREWLTALYEDEPRISVDISPDPYYCYEHGKTALFYHHGHKRKIDSVDTVFAAKFREVFGRTKHAYAHMGHLHNDEVKESNLMKKERHRTLASPDAFASRGGWVSGRDAKCITYHKEYGEVTRITVNPEMVKAA